MVLDSVNHTPEAKTARGWSPQVRSPQTEAESLKALKYLALAGLAFRIKGLGFGAEDPKLERGRCLSGL